MRKNKTSSFWKKIGNTLPRGIIICNPSGRSYFQFQCILQIFIRGNLLFCIVYCKVNWTIASGSRRTHLIIMIYYDDIVSKPYWNMWYIYLFAIKFQIKTKIPDSNIQWWKVSWKIVSALFFAWFLDSHNISELWNKTKKEMLAIRLKHILWLNTIYGNHMRCISNLKIIKNEVSKM